MIRWKEIKSIKKKNEPISPGEKKYIKENEIIENSSKGIRTRSSIRNECQHASFLSQIEPKNVKEGLDDEN